MIQNLDFKVDLQVANFRSSRQLRPGAQSQPHHPGCQGDHQADLPSDRGDRLHCLPHQGHQHHQQDDQREVEGVPVAGVQGAGADVPRDQRADEAWQDVLREAQV